MQQPTATNIRIRSTRDAHTVFHAVSLGILPAITRRLDADERQALRSGCIYAWEERGPHTEVTGIGIERFTEGRRWGPSRVRDEFLFYYEKSPPGQLRDKENPLFEERMRKAWDPLVKQTYSVWVDGPRGRRKWHLTAYFTQATVDRLQTVDDKPELASLDVPPGKYISTRLGKPRRTEDSNRNVNSPPSLHDVFRPANAAAPRTYAPFPMPFQVTPPQPGGIASTSQPYSHSNQHSSPAINGYDYAQQQQVSLVLPTRGETSRQNYGGMPPRYPEGPTLPPINSLASPSSAPPVDQQIPDYFSTMQQRAFSQRAHDQGNYGVPAPAPPHYLHYPHTQEAQRQFMQLPTPTSSSSHSSPVYSPHEQSDGSSYGGHLMLSYPSPASSGGGHLQAGASYPSQEAPSYGYSYPYSQERRSGPPGVSSYESANAPSPEDQKSSSESPANRPILTLPPHIANRYTPPLSDAREDNDGSFSSGFSPPQSPLSAVSSSSIPGGKQINLAPLRTLVRAQTHPYRRDKFDDKALMALSGRRANE